MAATYTDQEIRQNVLDEIRNDVRLDSTNVNIDVSNGIVTLSGTVPTYFEKVTAGSDAERIKGVRGVTNDLGVSVGMPFTDQSIQTAVQRNLMRDVRIVNPRIIGVSVTNGVVTLTGTVPTYSQKTDAADDTWTTPGVVDVVNDIIVAPPSSRSDAEIADSVRSALTSDPSIETSNVQINVADGTVYLRGTMPTFYQIQGAGNDAWSVPDVTNVVNELSVSF